MKFLLLVTNPRTGYVSVLTFPTRCDRGLHVITLTNAPVLLELVDVA